MVSIHRDGFMIEQCAACRGVFLAAPELGRLFEAAEFATGAGLANGSGRPPSYEGRHRRI